MAETHPKGFFKDVGHWIKKHPLAAAVIGVLIGVLVYYLVTNSQAQANGTTQGGNETPDIIIVGAPPAATPSPTNPNPDPGSGNPGGTKPPVKTKPPIKVKPPKRKGAPIIKKKPTPVIHHPKGHGYEPIPIHHAPGHGPAHMPPSPKPLPPERKRRHG